MESHGLQTYALRFPGTLVKLSIPQLGFRLRSRRGGGRSLRWADEKVAPGNLHSNAHQHLRTIHLGQRFLILTAC